MCVRAFSADAFRLGYRVFVPCDCVMATSEKGQRLGLQDLGRLYGVATSSEELMRQWKRWESLSAGVQSDDEKADS